MKFSIFTAETISVFCICVECIHDQIMFGSMSTFGSFGLSYTISCFICYIIIITHAFYWDFAYTSVRYFYISCPALVYWPLRCGLSDVIFHVLIVLPRVSATWFLALCLWDAES